ncbi:hypothetical protein Agub_g9992 [Astrephomene gubernaculifera]|uniref:Uncharacterized protein n=1 Tax=Astrephomene gubernaculifera TaxID=47775 RepID=A0AAD3HPL6_9CHLO|nr:hypothetical protein Agub_g9992 [Astrephomene gubernaculifera]
MHVLPCSRRGEGDDLCMALTQISRELLGPNGDGLQAGGCDSSDCLFCQYRSHSPFHLNAYAGKLTSLLRKRSLNGNSFHSILSAHPEHSSTLPTALDVTSAKRQKSTISSTGFTGASVEPSTTVTVPPSLDARDFTALNPQHRSRSVSPHNCNVMRGLPCASHLHLQGPGEQVAAAEGLPVAAPTAVIHLPAAALQAAVASAAAISRQTPSSSQPQQHPRQRRHSQPPHVPLPPGWSFRPEWAQRAEPAPAELQQVLRLHAEAPGTGPACGGSGGSGGSCTAAAAATAVAVAATAAAAAAIRQEAPCGAGRCGQEPAARVSTVTERREEVEREEEEGARRVGDGSGGGSWGCGGRSRVTHRWSGSGSGAGTGIVCALEFSPDGRLLAAGGVDKQVRLYSLADAFGDMSEDPIDPLVAAGADEAAAEEEEDEDPAEVPWGADGAGFPASHCSDLPCWPPRRAAGCSNGDRGGGSDGAIGYDDVVQPYGGDADMSPLVVVQRMPSKISSMAWSPFQDGILTVGDYDGVLTQLHLASGHQLADVEAHGGRKIWSVVHSRRTPHLVASAADDRCVRLWSGRDLAQCVVTLQPNPRASVCCVDLSSDQDHLLAAACSDSTAYVYDMRRMGGGPLAALRYHSRPASYCRFFGANRIVTAATDASIALWDLPTAMDSAVATASYGNDATAATVCTTPYRVFRGHHNEKNFVGLSVRPAEGLLACGSECSRAFAYHTSWSAPLAAVDLSDATHGSVADAATIDIRGGAAATGVTVAGGYTSGAVAGSKCAGGGGCEFVSAVCWQPAEAGAVWGLPPLLASATSRGGVSLSVLARYS